VPDFVEVAKLEELPPGSGTSVTVKDKSVAIFNVDGTVYAISDTCLHRAMPLGMGVLEGKVVRCRAHGWKYDVTSGAMPEVPGMKVGCFQAKVEDGKILVAVE
jgi:nitrite reductase/ring-hydroxylating ferredoxin subunit